MIRLTPVSYIVLGLVAAHGRATPYELKASAGRSIGNFWSVQHAQLYSEPDRLARAGLLDEERERSGRRRRTFTLTDAGRAALDEWLATPAAELGELRSPGLLQLFFGADPARLGAVQAELHERKLADYEALHEEVGASMSEGMRLALEAGIGHEREWVRFWRELAARDRG